MFERILVVVDGRRVSQAAVAEGAALARVHGAELILFCVMPRYAVPVADVPEFMTVTPQEFSQAAHANAAQWLADASACAGRAGVRCRTVTGSDDDPVPSIVHAARQHRCELVVVASEGRNALVRLISEGVVPGLVTASPVPVLVCKAGRHRHGGARAAIVAHAAGGQADAGGAAAGLR